MFKLEVVRSYLKSATVGYMVVGGKTIETLERPWLNNKSSVSCIPEGSYIVKRDYSGRFQYYAIQNVPNRTLIEIHPANKVSELEGCLTLGLKRNTDNVSVISSRLALDVLLDYIGENDFMLTFRSYNPNTDGELNV